MAKKRMISLQIVDTDAFLEMPATTQLLYFHLTVRADDEGFVDNPKKISRLIGLQSDDLKILIAKRFVLAFNSGVVVIKHWLIHNNIRMDRFNKTMYIEEKQSLILKENKSYTENGNQMATIGCHNLSQVKLSKAKLSKNNTDSDVSNFFKIRNNRNFGDNINSLLEEEKKEFFLKAETIFNDNPSAFFEGIEMNRWQAEEIVADKTFLLAKQDVILKAFQDKKIKKLSAYIWKVYEEFSDGR